MQLTIDETNRRREKQMKYNIEHNITPKAVGKNSKAVLTQTDESANQPLKRYQENNTTQFAAEPQATYSVSDIEHALELAKKNMKDCAKRLEFLEAAQYRDQIVKLEAELAKRKK